MSDYEIQKLRRQLTLRGVVPSVYVDFIAYASRRNTPGDMRLKVGPFDYVNVEPHYTRGANLYVVGDILDNVPPIMLAAYVVEGSRFNPPQWILTNEFLNFVLEASIGVIEIYGKQKLAQTVPFTTDSHIARTFLWDAVEIQPDLTEQTLTGTRQNPDATSPDKKIRQLERLAAAGDVEAQIKLQHTKEKYGQKRPRKHGFTEYWLKPYYSEFDDRVYEEQSCVTPCETAVPCKYSTPNLAEITCWECYAAYSKLSNSELRQLYQSFYKNSPVHFFGGHKNFDTDSCETLCGAGPLPCFLMTLDPRGTTCRHCLERALLLADFEVEDLKRVYYADY